MELTVERAMTMKGYIFTFYDEHTYSGIVNYTFGIKLRKIVARNQVSGEILCLKQKSVFLKMINMFPLLQLHSFPRFLFYNNGVQQGKTYVNIFSPKKKLVLGENCYELYLHNNNYISVLENETQIALIQKTIKTVAEKNRYEIMFDEKAKHNFNILLLLIMYIDVVFFPNRFRFDYIKYEKTIGGKKNSDRINWRPSM